LTLEMRAFVFFQFVLSLFVILSLHWQWLVLPGKFMGGSYAIIAEGYDGRGIPPSLVPP